MLRKGCETSCFTAGITVTPLCGEELVGNVAALTEPEKKTIVEKTVIRSKPETRKTFKRLMQVDLRSSSLAEREINQDHYCRRNSHKSVYRRKGYTAGEGN